MPEITLMTFRIIITKLPTSYLCCLISEIVIYFYSFHQCEMANIKIYLYESSVT